MSHTCFIVGCGGVGSWLIPLLARLKCNLELYDGDKFEPKNLDRQLFPPNFIGRNKAEAMGELYKCKAHARYFSLGWIEPTPEDWLIICADNHPARAAGLQTADDSGCRIVIAANEYTDAEAYIYKREWRGSAADPRVRYPHILTDTADDPLRQGAGCVEQSVNSPQLVVANTAAAVYAAQLYHLYQNGSDVPEKYWPIHHKSNELKHTTITYDESTIL